MKSKSKKSDRKSAGKASSTSSYNLTFTNSTDPSPYTLLSSVVETQAHEATSQPYEPVPAAQPVSTGSIDGCKTSGRRSLHPDSGGSLPSSTSTSVKKDETNAGNGAGLVLVESLECSVGNRPDVAEVPEMGRGFLGLNAESIKPPVKRMKLNKETHQPVTERCNAGVLTDPDWLGPCDPGSSVILEGIVWNESRNGLLVVNVTWRGKTYVGTLMDSTNHHWASPSFKEDSLSADNSSSSRDDEGGTMVLEGRRLRRCRTSQTSSNVLATATATSAGKTSNAKAKYRVPVLDAPTVSAESDVIRLRNHNGELVFCPELHCQKKFKHEAALRSHRFRAHKMATTFETVGQQTALTVGSTLDDSGRRPSYSSCKVQNVGVSPLMVLPSKQKSFHGDDEDADAEGISINTSRVPKKSEDGILLSSDRDGEHSETDGPSYKSSLDLPSDKADCLFPCHSEFPATISLDSVLSSTANSPAASAENGPVSETVEKLAIASVVDSDEHVSKQSLDGIALELLHGCDNTDCKQKARSSSKKKCKGKSEKSDRVQKNSEIAQMSSNQTSQIHSLAADAPGALLSERCGSVVSLQALEEEYIVKCQKTCGEMPASALSVSINRIATKNDPAMPQLSTILTVMGNGDALQNVAEKKGSCSETGISPNIKCLGVDISRVYASASVSNCTKPDTVSTENDSLHLLSTSDLKCKYHLEKTKTDASALHDVGTRPCKIEAAWDTSVVKVMAPLPESGQFLADKSLSSKGEGKTFEDQPLASSSLLLFGPSKCSLDRSSAMTNTIRENNAKHLPFLSKIDNNSKPALDHIPKELVSGSYLASTERPKSDFVNSTSSTKLQNVFIGIKTPVMETVVNQIIPQRSAAFQIAEQQITNSKPAEATTVVSPALATNGAVKPAFSKDILCSVNGSNSDTKHLPVPTTTVTSHSIVPFTVPKDMKSQLNETLSWTQPTYMLMKQNRQHATTTSSLNDTQVSRTSTFVSTLPSSSMLPSLSTLPSPSTPDCAFVPFCRTIQGSQGSTSLPKLVSNACIPSSSLGSCPLEASTASEIFRRKEDGTWVSASANKLQQHSPNSKSCLERSLLKCNSQPSNSSPSLHQGINSFQQKKEKLISPLHSGSLKPPSSSGRALVGSHSIQSACPK